MTPRSQYNYCKKIKKIAEKELQNYESLQIGRKIIKAEDFIANIYYKKIKISFAKNIIEY